MRQALRPRASPSERAFSPATSISWWSWWRTRCCGRGSTRQEFAKARTLAVQSIAAAKDADPRQLIGIYGDAWLFRGHPYGRPTEGSEKSLESISLDDLKSYYAAQCGGDRLIVTVVGDIRAAEMKRRLEAAFGGWQKSTVAAPAATAMARVQGRRVLLVDKPGATQTYFWLGNVGADRTDPARAAQSVANTIFGGRFTSMLNTELRIKSGLSYGASSGFARLTEPGAFQITSYTQTEKTSEAMDLALATLDRLHSEGLDADAIASAKSYLLGQFPTIDRDQRPAREPARRHGVLRSRSQRCRRLRGTRPSRRRRRNCRDDRA